MSDFDSERRRVARFENILSIKTTRSQNVLCNLKAPPMIVESAQTTSYKPRYRRRLAVSGILLSRSMIELAIVERFGDIWQSSNIADKPRNYGSQHFQVRSRNAIITSEYEHERFYLSTHRCLDHHEMLQHPRSDASARSDEASIVARSRLIRFGSKSRSTRVST